MNNKTKINELLFNHLCLRGWKEFKTPADIKPEHRIVEDLGADSLEHVEILMALEEMIKKEISDTVAEEWKTVGDIYSYIEANI